MRRLVRQFAIGDRGFITRPLTPLVGLELSSRIILSPTGRKVNDVAGEFLGMLAIVKMARIVDDQHAGPRILLRDHLEERESYGRDRRRIVLPPVQKRGRLKSSFLDPSSHLLRSLGHNFFISLTRLATHRRL